MPHEDTPGRPFRRPGFILAAAAIALIAVLGLIAGLVSVNKPATGAGPVAGQSSTASPTPSDPEVASGPGGDSVCGLRPGTLEGTLSKAPDTEWKYLGASAYPSSTDHGPAASSDEGYLYCFQQSPEGAVFAAATAAIQGGQPTRDGWMEYFLADTAGRATALRAAELASEPSGDRLQIQGFRLLSYDGSAATVDIAVRATPNGRSVLGSAVFDLVWEAGDWKLVVRDNGELTNEVQLIPDLAGYVSWRE